MQLSKKGYSFCKEGNEDLVEYFKKFLTVKPRVNPENPNSENVSEFSLYKENSKKMYIPKALGLKMYGIPEINTLNDGIMCERLTFLGELRENQKESVKLFLEAADNPKKQGGIISLSCAAGKTVIALYIACQLKRKTLIVCHKSFLLDQWKERISQFIPTAKVGLIKAQIIDVEDKDIVIGSLQSIAMKDYDRDVFKDFHIAIFDECFPYKQKIATDKGPIEIGVLYKKWKNKEDLPKVLSYNEKTKEIEYKNISHAWEKQNENLLKISYSKSNIKCTINHKILTIDGYKEANKLIIGDLLLCNVRNDIDECMVARTLNEDQYQIMLGSFLGDGNIDILKSKRYRLRVVHCEKQREYCEWKANMFNSKLNKIENNGYSKKIAYNFTTKIFDLPENKNFPKTKYTCPQWVLDELDYKGLSIWWMDDGTLSGFSGVLSTCSFDKDSQERIVKKLIDMGIECCYRIYNNYYSIYINKNGIYTLLKYIRPYMHNNMKYKFYNNKLENVFNEYYNGDLNTIYNGFNNININNYKINDIIKIKLRKNCSHLFYSIKYSSDCDKNTLHMNNICKKLKYYYNEPPNIYELYKWNNKQLEYGTVKITGIESVKTNSYSYNNHVYDIEVEDNHNFICSSSSNIGPIVHNCHHLSAEVFSRALNKCTCKVMLGLSATLNRSDGLRKVFEWYIGEPVIETKKRTDTDMIIKMINYYDTDVKYGREIFMWNKKRNIAGMITTLCEFHVRTSVMINELKEVLNKEPDRKTIIISDRINHLKLIEKEIMIQLPGKTIGYYIGGMISSDLKNSENAEIMLGTYKMISEGFDVPQLNTLVLASPISAVEQSIGRVQRQKQCDRKYTPYVIDMWDNYSLFKNQGFTRHKFYKKNGYKIIIKYIGTQVMELNDNNKKIDKKVKIIEDPDE